MDDGSAFLVSMQPLAEALGRRYAPVDPAERDDLIQFALYELHLAQQKVGALRKPYAFGRMVLQHAMMSMVRRAAKQRETPLDDIMLPDVTKALPAVQSSADEDIALQDYFTALERTHGTLARSIAENLCSPRDERVCRFLVEDTVTRAVRAQRAGIRPRGLRRIRVTRHKVRVALGVDKGNWARQMRVIKGFTRDWLATAAA